MPAPVPAPLTDGRVRLEPYAADHVADLVAAVRESLAELGPWLPWAHAGYGARDATEFLRGCAHAAADGIERHYAVKDAEGRFVGGLGLRVSDPKNGVGSIGYWVRTPATGRGHATAAVQVAARFAFDALGLQRIEIYAMPDNVASRRVAERAGARFEGIARNRIRYRGEARDGALYGLVPEDVGPASISSSGGGFTSDAASSRVP